MATLAALAVRKRSRTVSELEALARDLELGRVRAYAQRWSSIGPTHWSGVAAEWQGHPVRMMWIGGRRGVPSRVMVWIRFRGPNRLIIRALEFMPRPFGPPKVEELSSGYRAVRADDPALAKRILRKREIAEALLFVFHEVRIDRKGVRVTVPVSEPDAARSAVGDAWKLATKLHAALTTGGS